MSLVREIAHALASDLVRPLAYSQAEAPEATVLHLLDQTITSYSKAADTAHYTLGVVLQFHAAGTIEAVNFFKPSGSTQDADRAVGIWDHATGTLLASGSASFVGEAASPAWISVPLDAPLAIADLDAVIVGITVKNGGYAGAANEFASDVSNGPITAVRSSQVTGNGRFHAGEVLALPTDFFNATNYHVDVSFVPA